MAKAQMIVLAAAHEGQRQQLDSWYDDRHIPDLLEVPGIVGADRFDVRALKVPAALSGWDFMAIYHLESDDIQATLMAAAGRMGTAEMPASPALDSDKTLALVITEKAKPA